MKSIINCIAYTFNKLFITMTKWCEFHFQFWAINVHVGYWRIEIMVEKVMWNLKNVVSMQKIKLNEKGRNDNVK